MTFSAGFLGGHCILYNCWHESKSCITDNKRHGDDSSADFQVHSSNTYCNPCCLEPVKPRCKLNIFDLPQVPIFCFGEVWPYDVRQGGTISNRPNLSCL